MIDFEVIDVHMHLCRSVAQEQVVFPKPGVPDRWRWGAPDAVLPYMDRIGISHIVTLNIVQSGRIGASRLQESGFDPGSSEYKELRDLVRDQVRQEVRDFNRWAVDTHHASPRILACMFADPSLFGTEDLVREAEACVQGGAKGVKMHPYISQFRPDDRLLWPFYDRVSELGVPIVFDTGGREGDVEHVGRPMLFAPMLEDFPALTVIMAHLASAYWDERVALAQRFSNVVFDTAGGFTTSDRFGRGGRQALCEEDAVRVIRDIGAERIMFGSDGPVYDPLEQLIQIARLPLGVAEKRQILADNAKRIFIRD